MLRISTYLFFHEVILNSKSRFHILSDYLAGEWKREIWKNRTYSSNRSPNDSEWSHFSGRNISSIFKIFEYPFLNSGIVQMKNIFDSILALSRGFGGNFRCDDSMVFRTICIKLNFQNFKNRNSFFQQLNQ